MYTNVTPRATRTAAGDVRLCFPFDRRIVTELKHRIPAHARAYDASSKIWTVRCVYATVAIQLLLGIFPDAVIEEPGRRAEPQPDRGGDHFAALHLWETAPAELIETAYRTLARLYHPDRGGDVLAMQRINAAYGALTARLAA
jgi:hypothetical protein